jgi:hypothetical protein
LQLPLKPKCFVVVIAPQVINPNSCIDDNQRYS